MRIGFSRRKDMEDRPLAILIFQELVGYMESSWDPNERKKLNHKMYIKKGIERFLKEILQSFQVALFIDIRGKEKALWVKECLLYREELLFDGIYSYNSEECQ
jgi:hypothetical protein